MTTVESLMRQATQQHRAGNLAAAAGLYRDVLARSPNLADAHHLLGLTLHQQGNHAAARTSITHAIALNPDAAPFHGNLGLVLQATGADDAAIGSFRQALAIDPDYHPARFNLAAALAAQGRFDTALTELEQLLRNAGPSPDLHARLAECLGRTGQYERAVEHYQTALQAWPDDADLHASLARVWQLLGEDESALDAYDTALRLRPDLREAAINRATLLRDMGQPRAALDGYAAVLGVSAGDPEAIAGQVNTYERMGDTEQAWRILQPALSRHAGHPLIAVARAALAGRYEPADAALSGLDALARRTELPALQRQQVLFARARLLDRLARYDDAIADFVAANALTASVFDRAAHAARCEAIRAAYDGRSRPPTSGLASERPVFIVGMPRSGTSLVEEILASHPAVFGAGELSLLPRLLQSPPLIQSYPERVSTLDREALAAAAGRYLSGLESMDGRAQRITDKLPSNFLHLGLIRQLFPHARVIHITRDAMDTCLSCFCQNFGERMPYTADFFDLAAFYGEYRKMMAHWRLVVPDRMLEVRYEDLVGDNQYWIRRIVDFAELDWDPACLAFYESRRFVRTASYQQVRQPIYGHAIGRWRRYGAALDPLRRALCDVGALDAEQKSPE